jgi:hypothetical protein
MPRRNNDVIAGACGIEAVLRNTRVIESRAVGHHGGMRSTGLVVASALAACNSPHPTVADGPLPDGTADAVVPDASPPDAMNDGCPHRSAPAGQPDRSYSPAEVHSGDVKISVQADIDALAGIRMITGNLTIAGTVTTVSLPDLEVVGGTFDAENAVITELHLPVLETVGGYVKVYQTPSFGRLAVVDIPRLESIGTYAYFQVHDIAPRCLATLGGQIEVAGVTADPLSLPRLVTSPHVQLDQLATSTLELPAMHGGDIQITTAPLATIRVGAPDAIEITDDSALTDLEVSSTGTMSLLQLSNVPALANLDGVAHLAHLGYLDLGKAGALTSLAGLASTPVDGLHLADVPELIDLSPIADDAISSDLMISNSGATTVRFANVTALSGTLGIRGNAVLTTLDLPKLAMIGPFDSYITNNPMLPTCQAQAIAAHVTVAPGGTLAISGNGSGTCP